MASAAFALPSLEAASQKHEIALVVTQPDKPAGRGMNLKQCPVAARAAGLGLPLYQPKSIKSKKVLEKIFSFNPEIILVVAYGKMLPTELLNFPKYGCVNLHSSLLPKYRGAAPINWAVVNGEGVSGVTTMYISEELDAGDILLQEKTAILENDTAETLHNRLAQIGAKLLMKTIDGLADGSVVPTGQDSQKVTFAPIIKKEDGKIDWKKTTREIKNLIRGMQPWPGAFTFFKGKTLKFFNAEPVRSSFPGKPGEVVEISNGIVVATGDGFLRIDDLQIEGKRRMNYKDFLNGHKLEVKTLLG